MVDDNKNLAGEGERTSILPQSEPQVAEQTEVLPTHASQAETAQMPPVAQEQTSNAFAGTPLESVAGASVDDQGVTRPWLRAPRQGSLHRRRPRGASARPSPAPQQQCCPSASARASLLTQPSWGMGKATTSRATRMVTTTRATGMRMRVSGPVTTRGDLKTVSSRGRVMVSKGPALISGVPVMANRGRATSRAIRAALDRDLLRREAEAPAVRMEARAVPTPQPRMRVRPPVER